MDAISTLMELGFSRRDAARALHHAEGNVDKAYAVSGFLSIPRLHTVLQLIDEFSGSQKGKSDNERGSLWFTETVGLSVEEAVKNKCFPIFDTLKVIFQYFPASLVFLGGTLTLCVTVLRSSWSPVRLLRPPTTTQRGRSVQRRWSRWDFLPDAVCPVFVLNPAVVIQLFVCLQLLYLGFERDSSEAALRLTGGDVPSATQLLLDNQGVLSPELLSPPSTSSSPSSEEPSTSSNSPGKQTF